MFRECLLFLALATSICVWPLAAQAVSGYPTICRSSVPQKTPSSHPDLVETPILPLAYLDQIFRYGSMLEHDDSLSEFNVERANEIIRPFEYVPQCQPVHIDRNGLVRGSGGDARKSIHVHYTY